MITIKIDATQLAILAVQNCQYAGSTDWSIYTNVDGRLDVRHNTYDNNEWVVVYDFYYGYNEDDLQGEKSEVIEWMESDGIDWQKIKTLIIESTEFAEYDKKMDDFEKIEVKFI